VCKRQKAGCGGLKERREYDGGERGEGKGKEEEEREAYETFLQ